MRGSCMSRKPAFYWLAFFALNLIPVGAMGAEAPARDLSADELDAIGITVLHRGGEVPNNWDTETYLAGSIFSDCFDRFQISNTQGRGTLAPDTDIVGSGNIGFRVQVISRGGQSGLECQKSKIANHASCATEKCEFLSEKDKHPEARMKLAEEGSGPIQVLRVNPNADPGAGNRIVTESFKKRVPDHISKLDAEQNVREAREQARLTQIQHQKSILKACRKTLDDLPLARRAAEALYRLDRDNTDLRKILKQIDADELVLLEKQVKALKIGELEEFRATLREWNDEHPGNENKIAELFRQIALRYVNKAGGGDGNKPENCLMARATLDEAMELNGISDKTKAALAKDQDANTAGYLAALGMSGNTMAFYSQYKEVMANLQQKAWDSCYGQNAAVEACSSAIQAIQSVSAIPQTVQKAEALKQQQQAQVAQQIQQAMGGSTQAGIPMQSGGQVPQIAQQGQNMNFAGAGMPQYSTMPQYQNSMNGGMNLGMNAGMNNGVNNGMSWTGGAYNSSGFMAGRSTF